MYLWTSCFHVLHRPREKTQATAAGTGVDKGGPGGSAPPPMAGQKKFFVKTEGLLEPVVLNLSFRVRSDAMFTSESLVKDDISVTDMVKIYF